MDCDIPPKAGQLQADAPPKEPVADTSSKGPVEPVAELQKFNGKCMDESIKSPPPPPPTYTQTHDIIVIAI